MISPGVRRALRASPFVLLALLGGLFAYYRTFSHWMPYDDEGYVLTSLQSFVNGGALYTDVTSQYGPFYYELFGLLFAATGRAVTTDAGRMIVVALWVASAALMAWCVHGLTRNRLLSLAAMAVSLLVLVFLTAEPMHPVGLIVLLLCGLLALVSQPWAQARGIEPVVLGAICAALALTKINVGAFAVVAVVCALVAACFSVRGGRWQWVVLALPVVIPFGLLTSDLGEAWARRLLVVIIAGVVATGVVVLRRPPAPPTREQFDEIRWFARFVAGAGATALVIVTAALLLGTSLGDLIDGILIEPTRLRDIFVLPLQLPQAAVDWALIAVVAAVAFAWLPGEGKPRLVTGAARIAAGLVVWVSITATSPVTVSPGSGPVALACLLAWMAVRPAGEQPAPRARFARLVIVLLPLLEVLQAYPVAGTQQAASALLFVPAGALLLHDGATELRQALAVRSPHNGDWATFVGVVAAVALVAKFVVPILDSTQSSAQAYHDMPSLGVDGAHRVHVDAATAQALRTLVHGIRENCDTFITRPGINSLYVWTTMSPPTGYNAGDWMFLLDAAEQQRVVDAVERVERLCLVDHAETYQFWVGASAERVAPDRPLLRFVEETRWEPVVEVLDGRYRLLRR